MNPIDALFTKLRQSGRKALMPFLPAGDPSIAWTSNIVRLLDRLGAHLVEVGFPFSDPIADGPVIQASYVRALAKGLKVEDIFVCCESLTRMAQPVSTPLVAMASYSLIHRRGPTAFLDRACRAGLSGMIVPDLPADEATDFVKHCNDRGLASILLVTPTTTPERAQKIVRLCSGFVYCVSVSGITGERDRLPEELRVQLRQLRTMTDLPLCVGFGVSKPEHAAMLREEADGIIVGSALVRRIEACAAGSFAQLETELGTLVTSLLTALNPPHTLTR
jgi:tryptophan synthase alpha chain